MIAIGALSRETGVKVPTIRFYEQIGLLGDPGRTAGGWRAYGPESVQRLAFIRHARALGFEIEDIRALIGLSERPDQSCAAIDEIARGQLASVEDKLSRLESLRTELKRMLTQCAHGSVRDCQVLESLSTHSQCGTHHTVET